MLQITAVGNLAADPETREIGKLEVTNFTVLVNKKRKDEEYVTALRCAVWGARAPLAFDILKKGMQVTVGGSAHMETYETKNGDTRAVLVVDVNDFRVPPKPKVESAEMPF